MSSALLFTGNESINQIVDALKAGNAELYQPEISISTLGGSFTGRLIAKGSNWIVLEHKTGRKPVTGNSEVLARSVIALSAVISINFETCG